jgi:hypothetical protein
MNTKVQSSELPSPGRCVLDKVQLLKIDDGMTEIVSRKEFSLVND